jgi:CSLREA domain-containing protein
MASTYVVDSTADDADATPGDDDCDITGVPTDCTLRAAIQEANIHVNGTFVDEIDFSIGSGVQTITPATALPTITERVAIEGSTQDGFAGTPLIGIDGAGSGGFDGLTVGAGGGASALNNLALFDFADAIQLDGSALEVMGNYIGLKQDGTASPSWDNDLGIRNGSTSGTTIGDQFDPALRNVISNNRVGVDDSSGGGAQIYGNYIGTNVAGTADLGNTEDGVRGGGGGGSVIISNTISGNDDDGVDVVNNVGFISFNRIGTNAAGTAAIPNSGSGVELSDTVNEFNGDVISGNAFGGVRVLGGSTIIKGSLIGVGANGTTPIPNLGAGGIDIASSGNTVGGTSAALRNVIANNVPFGVRVTAGTGNRLIRNSVFSNSGLGIDLGGAGITGNDAGDGDGGANLQQNFPVLTSAPPGGAVAGTLNSTPNTAFTIDLFSNATCDASGNGEGVTYFGSPTATTNAAGNASFSFPLPASATAGKQITATATSNTAGNTSEFSACRTVGFPPAGGGGGTTGNREPDSDIKRVRSQKARKLKRFSGTASDPDGNLARVEISLVAVTGGAKASAKRRKRCLRLAKNGKLKKGKPNKRGRCKPAKFLRAKGTAKWSFKLKRRLPRGSYVLYSRAVDRAGKSETKFSKRDRNRRAFKLR